MNKRQLIKCVAGHADITNRQATKAVNYILNYLEEEKIRALHNELDKLAGQQHKSMKKGSIPPKPRGARSIRRRIPPKPRI
jgi:hypothetical protein